MTRRRIVIDVRKVAKAAGRGLLEGAQQIAKITGIGAALVTLAGFAGSLWWLFDLAANFRVQLFGALLLCAAVLATWRWWAVAAAAAFALINLVVIAPLWIGSQAAADPESPQLRLTLFNVNAENRDHAALAGYLGGGDSDIVIVLEVTREFLPALEVALPGYRTFAEPRPDSFGIAVFTRLPGDGRVIELEDGGLPAVELRVELGDRSLELLAIHPFPPLGAEGTARRDRSLAAAAAWVESRDGPVIVAGDLNATPFSSGFRRLRGDRLVNSGRGFGVQATWSPPISLMSVPIDHVLLDPRLTTVDRRVGPALGSDHRPVHVTAAWRAL